MYLPWLKKIWIIRQNTLQSLFVPLLSSLCLALPIASNAAQELFSVESQAAQDRILTHAGPTLNAAIHHPYVEKFVLAKAHPEVVTKQANEININLTQGNSITVRKIHAQNEPPDMLVWEGERPNQKRGGTSSHHEIPVDLFNTVTLVRHNSNITGRVQVGSEIYQIIPVENGEHAIIKIDARKFPQGHDNLVPPDYNKREWMRHLPSVQNAHSVIRVMVPITKQVEQRLRDVPGQVALAFALANQAAANSGADVTFVNAGIYYTHYDENLSSSYDALLDRLENRNDPELGGPVNAYRNDYKIHLIAMLVAKDEVCGRAWQPATKNYPTSLTTYTCISNLTFHHEIGHNLGAGHDMSTDPTGSPAYAHGFLKNTGLPPYWRTVLAYDCRNVNCPKINIYSNPNRRYNAIPTGTVTYEDNVRRINEYRHTITGFFPPFRLENRSVPGQCVDVLGGNPETVGVYPCQSNNPNQLWVADNMGRIFLNSRPDLCLAGGPEGYITLKSCTYHDNRFIWRESNENYINAWNNECLNPLGGAATGARLNLNGCYNTDFQRWIKIPPTGGRQGKR
jgi:peptidyl-Asp metalloendopeptidase